MAHDCAARLKLLCVFISVIAILLPACATLPDKAVVTVGKEQFSYALKGTGKPAVIFEAGLGGGMDSWAPVYAKVAAFTTVFAYDRRGYGDSGKPAGALKIPDSSDIIKTAAEVILDAVAPGSSTAVTVGTLAVRSIEKRAPRTGAVIVAELHEVLKVAGVQPPYILIGHSLGGLYSSLYARTYAEEVAGLILVDSMHPEQIERCQKYLPPEECDPEHYPWWVKMLIKMSPGVIKAEMAGAPETGRQVRVSGQLPPVPLVVLSHGKPPADEPGMGEMWAALQQDLAGETPGATRIIARNSGHNIQGDEPELLIQTIKELVIVVRQGGAITQ